MFDKLREKWRKGRESKARRKAAFNAIGSGYPADVKAALSILEPGDLRERDPGMMMKSAIDRQDLTVFKEVLVYLDDPNTTIKYDVYENRSTYTYTYSPISYALEQARTHDISLLLASNPRTNINDKLLESARSGGMQDVAAVLAKRIAELRRQEAVMLDREAAATGEPAAVTSTPAPASTNDEPLAPGETWALMSKTSVAHVTSSEIINRKLTEIFNFESRERVQITENLKTGVESIGKPESFDTLGPETVSRAQKMLQQLVAEQSKKSLNL